MPDEAREAEAYHLHRIGGADVVADAAARTCAEEVKQVSYWQYFAGSHDPVAAERFATKYLHEERLIRMISGQVLEIRVRRSMNWLPAIAHTEARASSARTTNSCEAEVALTGERVQGRPSVAIRHAPSVGHRL